MEGVEQENWLRARHSKSTVVTATIVVDRAGFEPAASAFSSRDANAAYVPAKYYLPMAAHTELNYRPFFHTHTGCIPVCCLVLQQMLVELCFHKELSADQYAYRSIDYS